MHRAFVTGGSRGIGRAIAAAILANGGHVMITGLNRERLDETVRALGSEFDAARIVGAAVDVRDRDAVDSAVAEAARRFGGLDTLVNNAGIGAFGEVASMSDAEWHRVIETNLSGAFFSTRA